MRDLFPGFYKRTEDELSYMWQKGIFVFDTNMLLNVYRYTKKTRDRYLEILGLLKQRSQLWIPYQAAFEYHDRRMAVIQGQLDAYKDVATILQSAAQKLENSLETYHNKHEFIHTGEMIEEINAVIHKAKTKVTQSRAKDKREYENLKKRDTLLEKLEELFRDAIGSPYTSEKQRELFREAQMRIELRIPPGWEDEDKKGYKKYGDILLWFQILDYARSQKKPIVFVTDDGKKDWWVRDAQGKPINPLPELVQEMFIEVGVFLHMYQGYSFMEAATRFFSLKDQPDIIKEAEKITEQNTLLPLDHLIQRGGRVARYGGSIEGAVIKWLMDSGEPVLPDRPYDSFLDSIIADKEKEWDRKRVVIKYKEKPFRLPEIKDLHRWIMSNFREELYSSVLLILVCESLEDAKITLEAARLYNPVKSYSIPLVIRVGYMTPTGRFEEVTDTEY